ncbi:lytic transglycosylase F [Methylophaga nitratireducenticrescens]|uniref:Membrane-bound lytic murein transglycosylase F n=1 Tax=Methylophaga nitratireducenticrescens TaxID=754476 RepID=I1XGS3_METNJ|nr:membrane-bound lytic murein transglycosylase MltF [Methylophaga nitratireducenticrescens]AFI83592.1 lytic transglycosylase F [Methylophaga nitratireducenticrescens]
MPYCQSEVLKKLIFLLCMLCVLNACNAPSNQLEQILERGELRVVSRYGLTSYYNNGDELAGFEFELAQRFADFLGVNLKISVPDTLSKTLNMIDNGQADIAAAGLTVTRDRQKRLRFGPIYYEATQQLIYRHGTTKPRDITEINTGQLEIVANSSHAEQLTTLQQEIPLLSWTENQSIDTSGLLELVQLELIDYTIVDSNEMAASHSLYPELRVAFDVSDPQPLAWGMRRSDDMSLQLAVNTFFDEIENSGYLDQLIEKYFGHIRRFDYVDSRAIHRRIQTHLPQYESFFKAAALAYNFDWRLLAAIAYQESHWNPEAVSSTGVRGLMMLTQATANEMGVSDRKDPQQSIFAGTAYLTMMKNRLPERIEEPDRTWLALAAYNIGLGHLEDARVLTQKNGGNPDRWADVRENLPLLAKQKWFSQTRYGYARGGEPVRYVGNIRRYYDIMLHHDEVNQNISTPPAEINETLPAAL